MKISLKAKLTISYILLSLLLAGSLLIASHYFLEQNFQDYIVKLQEEKNQNIIEQVTSEFGDNGELPDIRNLERIGNTALAQGLVLMVNDDRGNELFCVSTINSDTMIADMKERMANVYPNFNGEYTEKVYDIIIDTNQCGTITLGYYGPFFYNDEDVHFLSVLNNIFVIVAAVFIIIAAFWGFFMAERISNPVKKVIDQTRQIGIGNYSDRLNVDSKTIEINQLIRSINALACTLEKQQQSKKRMSRDYAHEFRTPLTTLLMSLEAMIDGIWEPTTERLESCREEVQRLTRMISDIDKIVKIEDDKPALILTKFDLKTITEQIIRNFQPMAAAQNITIESSLMSCEMMADQDKISQVIVNLLSNAVKYTDSFGKIKITVHERNGKAELIVADTGIGIAQEDLPFIYEHLYRTDKSRNRDTGGSGIGLSVVKAIIDAHNGTIETKSELSVGSEFKVILPM